jgi:hypothetical protein
MYSSNSGFPHSNSAFVVFAPAAALVRSFIICVATLATQSSRRPIHTHLEVQRIHSKQHRRIECQTKTLKAARHGLQFCTYYLFVVGAGCPYCPRCVGTAFA